MKNKYRLGLFYQKNWIVYLLIGLLFFLVWHKVLNQTFLGEGYYYFNPKLYLLKVGVLPDISDYDNFAKIFFQIVTPFFRDNLNYYFISELIIGTIFVWSYYYVIEKISEDNYIAICSTIFLSTSYLALFEYLGAGNYQRFIQRFPNLIPILFSFYFLWKFIKNNNCKYLFGSIALYIFAVIMGHFSVLTLPIFLILPTIYLIGERNNVNNFLLKIITCFLFVFFTVLLTYHSNQKPNYNLLEFLKNQPNVFERIFYQIPVITIPTDLLKHISLFYSLIICLTIYGFGFVLISIRMPKLKIFYLTCFFSMIGVMTTYLYTDPRLNVLVGYGEDRYYLLSTLFVVVLWSSILKSIFINNKVFLRTISLIIVSAYVLYNASLISNHFDRIQYQSEMYKKFISYFQTNRRQFSPGSIIVAPYYLVFASSLITNVTLTPGTVDFALPENGWEKKYWETRNKVFVFKYDNGVTSGTSYNSTSGHLIDLTDKYRSGQKINF